VSLIRGIGGVFDHALHGVEEGVEVVVDGRFDDRVGGVEVAVREVVAHSGDLAPRDAWPSSSHCSGSALTASPISRSRILTASKIRPSERSPRSTWERIAPIAATMSARRCWSR
jgi:hypothetical protein